MNKLIWLGALFVVIVMANLAVAMKEGFGEPVEVACIGDSNQPPYKLNCFSRDPTGGRAKPFDVKTATLDDYQQIFYNVGCTGNLEGVKDTIMSPYFQSQYDSYAKIEKLFKKVYADALKCDKNTRGENDLCLPTRCVAAQYN